MQKIKKSFDQLVSEKPSQLILGVIFILYILLNVQTPAILAGPIDNIFGKVLVVVVAAVIFIKTNPVIGILGFVVAYQLIKTASVTTGSYAKTHYLTSEVNKVKDMQSYNTERVQYTDQASPLQTTHRSGALEIELVDQMAPLAMNGPVSDLNYSPILDGQHSAALLHEA
jgi:hypothetical protein